MCPSIVRPINKREMVEEGKRKDRVENFFEYLRNKKEAKTIQWNR